MVASEPSDFVSEPSDFAPRVFPQARDELGWVATKTLDDMCADSWRWQSKNPMGMVAEGAAADSTA